VKRYITDPQSLRIDHLQEVVEQTYTTVESHKQEFTTQLRAAQKTSVDTAIRVKQIGSEFSREFADRPRKLELSRFQVYVQEQIQDMKNTNSDLQTQVAVKLNEFVEHFIKVHENIDDHEHCLRHHAEELENRSTKYELLTIQYQVDRCALKEEFTKETTELKRVQDWVTGRINSFALANIAPPGQRRGVRGRYGTSSRGTSKGTARRMLHSSMGSQGAETVDEGLAMSMPVSRTSADKTLPTRAASVAGFGISPGSRSSTDKGMPAQAENGEEDEGQVSGTLSAFKDHEEEDGDEGRSESESERGQNLLMRDQIEAISMALVGLGHLVLRETKLGTSRNAKLLQERDMLEELKNLRHWISNRMAPSGWDPGILTTVALRCSHLREDEHQLPLPQLPFHTPPRSHHVSSASSGSGRVYT